jgi:nicotinate-nucleotide pyrophosphorylase (carboxylating)
VDEAISTIVAAALAEDIGAGDITSEAVVPAQATARARIVQKQPGVLFGLEVAATAFAQTGADRFERLAPEGEWWEEVPADIAAVTGPARAILAAERTALNLLARLSGIATMTARYVGAIEGTGATILDTRKTTPGLRALEKGAVVAGGGSNHRMGLYDAVLIKENHVAITGGITEAIRRARASGLDVEVECRTLADVDEALLAGADRILLDNMAIDELRAAVVARDAAAGKLRTTLEASGGITLQDVRAIAGTGVDYISIGALTHSAPALDVSLLLGAA